MNLSEYQQLAKRTLENACMTNLRMGVIGETGEIVDYIKKVKFHGHELKRKKLMEELGDLMWYVASVATRYRFNLSKYEEHIPKTVAMIAASKRAPIEVITLSLYHGADSLVSALVCPSALAYFSVLEYIQWLADLVGATLSEVMEYNIKKLKKRYPDGFDKQRSIGRDVLVD